MPKPKPEDGKAPAAGQGKEAAGKPDERTPDEKDFARAMMEEEGVALTEPPAEEKPPEEKPPEDKPPEEKPPEDKPPEDKPPEDKPPEDKGDGLPPEVQEKIDKRIGKEVHRRKETEELLEAERTLVKELTEKVTTLEQQVREAPAGSAAINPLLMADSEAELDKREDFLWKAEEWCEENIDGYEGNGTKDDPSYTAAEIRRRLLSIRRERERDLPRARETLKRRTAFDAVSREAYPELADPRSELSVEASRLLARVPGLKAVPEYKLLLGDLLAGRAAREGKKAERKPAPRPPPAPGAPVPSRSGVQPTVKPPKPTVEETMAAGEFSDDALARALD